MNTSNKTPEKPVKKTASAPKPTWFRRVGYGFLAVGLAGLIVGLWGLIISGYGDGSCDIVVADTNPLDEVGESPRRFSGPYNECIQLERVSSKDDLERGLSGRSSMPTNQGMLFVFERSAKWCMWMKDMQFPIDMIWLNENKQVVHIARDVAPETYPERFCPPQQAKYVIEVNAGMAAQARLTGGSQLQF